MAGICHFLGLTQFLQCLDDRADSALKESKKHVPERKQSFFSDPPRSLPCKEQRWCSCKKNDVKCISACGRTLSFLSSGSKLRLMVHISQCKLELLVSPRKPSDGNILMSEQASRKKLS